MKLAIIPARGGSKRIKNKNIVSFCGKPLINYCLETVKNSGIFDEIHVSTEDENVKQIVETLGFKIEFMRNSSLSDDVTGLLPVMKWVLSEYSKRGKEFTDIALILPTSPLIKSEDLRSAYNNFIKFNKKYPTMACGRFPVPIDWAFSMTTHSTLIPIDAGKISMRSQDLPKYYFDSGAFSFLSNEHLTNGFIPEFVPYILPPHRSVDIDEVEDLELAEILYLGQKAKELQSL